MGCCASGPEQNPKGVGKMPNGPPDGILRTFTDRFPVPVPPWEKNGELPPGIIMTTKLPTDFDFMMSRVRSKKDESLQRLVILSSLVDDPQKVTN
eukprot:gene12502-15716_t